MIKSIILNPETIKEFQCKNDRIDNLSNINIFIGPNNSGKSRLLRELLRTELNFIPDENLDPINELINKTKTEIKRNMGLHPRMDIYSQPYNLFNIISSLQENTDKFIEYEKLHKEFIDKTRQISGRTEIELGKTKIMQSFQSFYNKMKELRLGQKINLNYRFKKIYIPVLRGIKQLGNIPDDIYSERVKNDYKIESKPQTIEVFSGMQIYQKIRDLTLGDQNARKLKSEFEDYLKLNYFENNSIELAPRDQQNNLYIKIGSNNDLPIHDLGDGVQSIIILSFLSFAYQDQNILFFIEEPELNLHPWLQRKFIETIVKFTNHQYFISSHSNHLIDMAMDFETISIYTIHKHSSHHRGKDFQKSIINNVNNTDNNILSLLGVRNSSIFLSNCVIWVEGITDRKYIRKFLEIYQISAEPKFKEDLHFSFIEYSGNNITHWSFLDNDPFPINVERICNKMLLISDKDTNKDKRHEKLKRKLGENFIRLDCLEIENLLAPEILTKVIKSYEGEAFRVPELNLSDYKNVKIGKFLKEKLGPSQKTYDSESGALNNKVEFCKFACDFMQKRSDLTEMALSLVEKIHNFIKQSNT